MIILKEASPRGAIQPQDLPYLRFFALPLETARELGLDLRQDCTAAFFIVDTRDTELKPDKFYILPTPLGFALSVYKGAPLGVVLGRCVQVQEEINLDALPD